MNSRNIKTSKQNDPRAFMYDYFGTGKIGAEVGVWKGAFSNKILQNCKPSVLYAIDPWQYNPNYTKAMYGGNNMSQRDMDNIYNTVRTRFEQTPAMHIVRNTTQGLATRDGDNLREYFDFVYIDGDHTFEGVMTDLVTTAKWVKKGGIISGDDYSLGGWWKDGVIRAVTMFVDINSDVELVEIKKRQFVLRKL